MKDEDKKSSGKDFRERIVKQFMDTIREMCMHEVGNNPDQIEQKEAVMVAQYIQTSAFQAFKMWREYKRFPLFQIVLYGDHKGGSMVNMDMTPSRTIQEVWQLPKLAKMIKDTIDKWDLQIQESGGQLPDIKMGQVAVDLSAYQAIADHLKKSED